MEISPKTYRAFQAKQVSDVVTSGIFIASDIYFGGGESNRNIELNRFGGHARGNQINDGSKKGAQDVLVLVAIWGECDKIRGSIADYIERCWSICG